MARKKTAPDTHQRAYKFELFPTPEQAKQIGQNIHLARKAWNWFLEQSICQDRYTNRKPCPDTCARCQEVKTLNNAFWQQVSKNFTQHKEDNPEFYEANSQALTAELQHLQEAFKHFFRRCKEGAAQKGFPKFKGVDQKRSFSQQQNNKPPYQNRITPTQPGKGTISMSKLKDIPIRLHRPIEGHLGTCTVSKTATNRYYVSITTTVTKPLPSPAPVHIDASVGVLRLPDRLELSTGHTEPLPKPLAQKLKRIKFLNRRLSNIKKRNKDWKTSKRYKHVRLQLAKIHEKIANQRNDGTHKLTHWLTDQFATIGIDDRPIQASMDRKTADAALYEITRQITYKGKWKGINVVEVPGDNPVDVQVQAVKTLSTEGN